MSRRESTVRVAFRLRVKPEKLDAYILEHSRVWPELLQEMSEAGIRNYTIFADGAELFGYYECDDPAAVDSAMAASETNRRWQAFMDGYLDRVPDTAPPRMTEVFRMD
jgi:L-rhamnose mutarotase